MNVQTALLKHREAIDRVDALRLSVRQAEENYRIMQTARTQVIYTYYELQRAIGAL